MYVLFCFVFFGFLSFAFLVEAKKWEEFAVLVIFAVKCENLD